MKYTLAQINNIIDSGIEYEISDSIVDIINELSSQVGAPNYVKTPVFSKRTNEKEKDKRLKTLKRKKTNDEWSKKSVFKTTKLDKSVGLQKNTDDIRCHLNKLTDKNCNDIFDCVVDIIDNLDDFNDTNISNVIFELASSNRFYSETYAKFYSKLISKYECINSTLDENCNKYIDMFNNIKYVDPNENYEQFCEMNKTNEKLRSLTAFLVNLMKMNVLSREKINNYLVLLLNKFDDLLNLDNMKNEINEICENIHLLYDNDYDYANYTLQNNMTIEEYLHDLANTSTSKYKSFTNKTKFKIMDMCNM